MPSRISSAGVVILHEPRRARGSEKTTGQTLSYSSFDSRLAVTSSTYLSYQRIRTIRRDATVQLARQAVVAPVIHTPWDYKTKPGAPSDVVEFLRNVFEPQRDWLLQNAFYNALDYGWAPFEVVYLNEDGKVIIDDFKQLIPDYTTILVYIENGQFAGFLNEPIQTGTFPQFVQLLRPYALNLNLSVEGTDWYGQSVSWVLDPIITNWSDVNTVANRYDRKIAGATWVVYYPVGETMFEGVLTANSTIAAAILTNLEASGGVSVPDEIQEWLDDSVDKELKGKWRIELLTAQHATQAAFIDRMKYLDVLKMRAFGLPERSILEGQHGTKAEAETHADLALTTVDTKHRLMCDQLNIQAIRPLLRMNYGKAQEKSAWIEPAPLVDAQFQTVKEIYRLLVQSPQIIAKEVQNIDVQSLRDQIGVPTIADAPNDFSEVEPQPQPFGANKDSNAQTSDKQIPE